MTDVATALPAPVKRGRSRKQALDQKNESSNEANIVDETISEPSHENALPDPLKKGRSRKQALHQKNESSNEANILAGTISEPSPPPVPQPFEDSDGKENHEILSQPKSPKKKSTKSKPKQTASELFEKELQEMQARLEKMTIEKEQTEELLKDREGALKLKEEELENRSRAQEKLQMELKKLQKLKEFKPSMTLPFVQSVRDKDQEKKKKGGLEHKRPATPYILWCKDQWNEEKKANPNAEFKEISNILGAKWKTISAEEKKPYEERYQAEKEAYLKISGNEKRENEAMKLLEEDQKQKTAMELLEQYIQFKQEAETENNKKIKKEKDPLKPKHPVSAYFLYTSDRRAALAAENKKVVEVTKITGEEWKKMSDKEKAPYEEVAKKNKEQYHQEMELYKQKKEEEVESSKKEGEELMKIQKQEALQLLKKKEKTENIIKKTKQIRQKKKDKDEKEKKNDPNKPKRPASSFLLFSKETRKALVEERPGINNSTVSAMISVKWKELSEEEKQVWNGKAAEAMEAYKKELEEYNNNKNVSAAESCSEN